MSGTKNFSLLCAAMVAWAGRAWVWPAAFEMVQPPRETEALELFHKNTLLSALLVGPNGIDKRGLDGDVRGSRSGA